MEKNINSICLAIMPKSELSIPVRVMNEVKRDELYYFVVRRATDQQWEDLFDILQPTLETRIPLRKGKRQMVFCRPRYEDDDLRNLDDYRFVLKTVFGPTCRIVVRLCKRVKVNKEASL